MKRVIHVIGTRPNFVKAAPVINALNNTCEQFIVHTGQHYSKSMSESFLETLRIPKPDINLNVGSGTHGYQTARVLENIEKYFIEQQPNLVVVYGDVNSTLAAALAAKKLNIKVAHVESGLRSNDPYMPEEVNRVLTDKISTYHFLTEEDAKNNLSREGIRTDDAYFVGNTMIDSLVDTIEKTNSDFIEQNFNETKYVLFTCHRPSNVDTKEGLRKVAEIIKSIEYPIVFPAHFRTLKNIRSFGLWDEFSGNKNLYIIEPVEYLEFLHMMKKSFFVITDSGGVQEETTFLGIPCLTFRKNTERPSTVKFGTNTLVQNIKEIKYAISQIESGIYKKGEKPALWDGKASQRIAKIINNVLD